MGLDRQATRNRQLNLAQPLTVTLKELRETQKDIYMKRIGIKIFVILTILVSVAMTQLADLYSKRKIDLLVTNTSDVVHYYWPQKLSYFKDNRGYPNPIYLGTLLFANTVTYTDKEVWKDTIFGGINNDDLLKYKLGWRNVLILNPQLAYKAFELYGEYFIERLNHELYIRIQNAHNDYKGKSEEIPQLLQTYSVDFFWQREHYIFSLYEEILDKLLKLNDTELKNMLSILNSDLISKRWEDSEEFAKVLESSDLIKWLSNEKLIPFGYGDLSKYPLDILILTNRIYNEYPDWSPHKFLREVQLFTFEVKKILQTENHSKPIDKNNKTIIKMEEKGGVYTMPCTVNGLRLNFIFDTGASNVSISLTEVLFMLKNGYLSNEDILGSEYYQIANGEITEGTKINLKQLSIGDIKLYNVKAGVVHNLNAPLLLGQSALHKLGKIEFDYSNNTLIIENEGY